MSYVCVGLLSLDVAYYFAMSFHIFWSFAALIHVSFFFMSLPFDSLVSSVVTS